MDNNFSEPFEIERKYLVQMPNLHALCGIYSPSVVSISQTYLTSPAGCERRVRQKKIGSECNYFFTEKKPISGLKREEREKSISRGEYFGLLKLRDMKLKEIKKTRYVFEYCEQTIELDVYPFWNDVAIVEVELNSVDSKVKLPPEFFLIREVTYDEAYKNHSLAGDVADDNRT